MLNPIKWKLTKDQKNTKMVDVCLVFYSDTFLKDDAMRGAWVA